MSDLLHTASELIQLADVFDPSKGGGEAPPGAGGIRKILRWVFWGVTIAMVAGFLIVAVKMVMSFRHGEGAESGKQLGIVAFACVLAGAASSLVAALI